jgi:hypothetical protein
MKVRGSMGKTDKMIAAVDEGEEHLPGVFEPRCLMMLLWRQAAVQEQVRHANDGGQWRSDLMTHRGQELGFRLVRLEILRPLKTSKRQSTAMR